MLLATSTSPAAMSTVAPTLAKNGTLLILGAGEGNLEVNPLLLIGGRRKVMGNPSGTAADSEDTMKVLLGTLLELRPGMPLMVLF